jgi:hypothetical protein
MSNKTRILASPGGVGEEGPESATVPANQDEFLGHEYHSNIYPEGPAA